ncbi:ribosome biogenesis protein SSF1/2 [Entomortierella parvispora]|uniref:Ribosome biogenesis protein SSF1/2 n=1 Tax=Entomortierella parvispora TaxID=205924 RepID=A0A9P3LT07_9FUNG|nr:ribosome biogenesis protein SSF1/2 [Entomortierella parvispora]
MALPNTPGATGKLPPPTSGAVSPLTSPQSQGTTTPPTGLQRLMPLHPTHGHPSPMGQLSPTQSQGQGGVALNQLNQINNNLSSNNHIPHDPHFHDHLQRQLLSIVSNRQVKLHRDVNGIIQSYNASMEQDMSFIVNTFIHTKAELEQVQKDNSLLREIKDQATAEIARLREAGNLANIEIGRLRQAGTQVQQELMNLRRLYQLLYNTKLTLAGGNVGNGEVTFGGNVVIPWNDPNDPITLDNPSPESRTSIQTAASVASPTSTPAATPIASTVVTPTLTPTSAPTPVPTSTSFNSATKLLTTITSPDISDGNRIIEIDSQGPETFSAEDEPVAISDIEMVSKELLRATEDIAALKKENQRLVDHLESANKRGDDLELSIISKQAVNKTLADLYGSRNRSLMEKTQQMDQMRLQLEQAKADIARFHGLLSTATTDLQSAQNFIFAHYGALARSVAEKKKQAMSQQGPQSPGTPTQLSSPSFMPTAETVMRTLETSVLETAKAASSIQDYIRPTNGSEHHSQAQQLAFPPVGSFGSSAPTPPVHTFRPTGKPTVLQPPGRPAPMRPAQMTPVVLSHHLNTSAIVPGRSPGASPGRPSNTLGRPPGKLSGSLPVSLQSGGPTVHSFGPSAPIVQGEPIPAPPSTAHSFRPTLTGKPTTPMSPPQCIPGPLPTVGTFKPQSNLGIHPSQPTNAVLHNGRQKTDTPSAVIDLTSTDSPPLVPELPEPSSLRGKAQPAAGGTFVPTAEPGALPLSIKQHTTSFAKTMSTENVVQQAPVAVVTGQKEDASGLSSNGVEKNKEVHDASSSAQKNVQQSKPNDAGQLRIENNKQNAVTPPNKVSTPSNGNMAWMAVETKTTTPLPPAPVPVLADRTNTGDIIDSIGPSSTSGGPNANSEDNATKTGIPSTVTPSSSSGAATSEGTHPQNMATVSTGGSLLTGKLLFGVKANGQKPLSSSAAVPPSAAHSASLSQKPSSEAAPVDSNKKGPRNAEKQAKAERVAAARKRLLAKAKAFEEMMAAKESTNLTLIGGSSASGNGASQAVPPTQPPIHPSKKVENKPDRPPEDILSGEDERSPSLSPPPPSTSLSSSSPSPRRSSSSGQIAPLEAQTPAKEVPAVKEVRTATLARKSSFVKIPGRFYLSAVEIPIRDKVNPTKRSSAPVAKKTQVKAPTKRKWVIVSGSDEDDY